VYTKVAYEQHDFRHVFEKSEETAENNHVARQNCAAECAIL
jgi:hypothetical protein